MLTTERICAALKEKGCQSLSPEQRLAKVNLPAGSGTCRRLVSGCTPTGPARCRLGLPGPPDRQSNAGTEFDTDPKRCGKIK